MNMYAKFQLHPPSEEKIFEYFFENLSFICMFLSQPIKFSDLDKIHMTTRETFLYKIKIYL